MRKILEKVINIVLDVFIFLFGIILIITIYNNIQIKILKNSYSSFFGYSVFGVQTGSMEEEINAGDWIIVKNSNKFKLNDIVTYYKDGDFITHRIVEAYNGTYVTKGDANNTKDEPINEDQIVGKVVKILPNFTAIKKVLFNPFVVLAIIVTLYLINILFKKDKNVSENNKFITNIKKIIDNLITKLKENDKLKNIAQKINKFIRNIIEKNVEVKEIDAKNEEVQVEKIEEVIETLNEEDILDTEDLDKTKVFRMIAVDEEDANGLGIVKDEKEEIDYEKIAKNEVEIVTKEEEIIKTLEMLQKKRRKFSNVIEKIMFLKEEQINSTIDSLLDKEKVKTNEASIKNMFIKGYIDAKYYNHCGDVNAGYNTRNVVSKLEKTISEIADNIFSSYKGTDKKYKEKVNKYKAIFNLIIRLDHDEDMIDGIKLKRETYSNNIIKFIKFRTFTEKELNVIVNSVIKDQKLYSGMIKYILDKLQTNVFKLEKSSTSIKNLYAIRLEHNISFSKVYSDYIVDRTYSEGIVAEDKMEVLLTLLSSQIVSDMLEADFKNKYLINIPNSLFEKGNKLNDVFKQFKDEYAKNSIIVVVDYNIIVNNKSIIKKLIKEGYHFAMDLNKVTKFRVSDQSYMEIVDYMFLSKDNINKNSILLFIPKDLQNKILYDDIMMKIGG